MGLTNYSDFEWLWGNRTEGFGGDVNAIDAAILSLLFKIYWIEFKGCQVEDWVAKCWLHVSGAHVWLCQIEITSRISGMRRARDSEAAALGDGYFVWGVDHHCMGRWKGDAGLFQFHCRTEIDFYKLIDHKTCLQSEISQIIWTKHRTDLWQRAQQYFLEDNRWLDWPISFDIHRSMTPFGWSQLQGRWRL